MEYVLQSLAYAKKWVGQRYFAQVSVNDLIIGAKLNKLLVHVSFGISGRPGKKFNAVKPIKMLCHPPLS